ncbi:UNVERIFIED_CONTAM: Phosphatidate phosphatase PAH2 [Sesamum angustifolium]|uniref:Phosphatidate phosphatase PAH2 n=1 Tax=Sesamum angustifolium TaxID=2727405 RepID=A0AAW2L7K3_9LAMI
MQAVGKLGSYISRSVYTVSGPFHPFGGAVDIIVVEQPDGSYKSSPWYVRFGKFQGVLKTKEKVVSISVNGVEADFHMYLDHKGEAFFLKEVDVDAGESPRSPPSSLGEDMDKQPQSRLPLKSKSCNYTSDFPDSVGNERNGNCVAVARTTSRRSQILSLVFGRRTMKEEGGQEEKNAYDMVRTDSLERAEIAADLLDLKWSTNLASSRNRKDNASRFSTIDTLKDEANINLQVGSSSYDETGLISHTSYQELESTVEENVVEMKCLSTQYLVQTPTKAESVGYTNLSDADELMTDKHGLAENSVSIVSEFTKAGSQIEDSVEKLNGLADTSFSKANARDRTQSFYHCQASETSRDLSDASIERKTNLICHGVCEEVCVQCETVQDMALKSEPERDVIHAQEKPLTIQHGLREGDGLSFVQEEKTTMNRGTIYGASESNVTECYPQLIPLQQSNDFIKDVNSQSFATASSLSYSTCSPAEEQTILAKGDTHISVSDFVPQCIQASRILEEEQLLFGIPDDCGHIDGKQMGLSHADLEGENADSSFPSGVAGVNEANDATGCSVFSLDQSVIDDYINDANLERRKLRSISSDLCVNKTGHVQSKELTRMVRSLPSRALRNNLEASDLGHASNPSLYPGMEGGANSNSHQLPCAQTMAEDVMVLKENKEGHANPSIGKRICLS